ncbi:Chemotaxis protein CheV [Pirellula sp. SH-Sr6A]|uniref:chemotaxis protein CheW n=1 Tax=Pirellula sp. SH-Sr6A TaxID=1632865 RepID=UPI00078D0AED|nr:chemotaxis protein CheW [Pirellula sp. SH-Sr6A]AMV31444.1 Chemotaxis protein CheV [Pirellula sp. SH-Sr6A]
MLTIDCKTLELMTFKIGSHEFGLHIDGIQEINCHAQLKQAPVAYQSVAGIINLRGEVLTVIALGRLLGIQTTGAAKGEPKFIVLKNSDERIALLVDEVADVETFPTAALQTLPTNFSFENGHVVQGLIQKPKGLLLVLEASELPKLGVVLR